MFNSEHQFKTEKQSKKGSTLRFIAAFLAFLLVFGSVSVYVMIKNKNLTLKDMLNGKSGEETSQTEDSGLVYVPEEISGCRNFLFYCSDSSVSTIHFIAVVAADMGNKTFRVLPVDPSGANYISELKAGGERALKTAVEKKLGIKIEKYVASTAETFALAINYMDGLEFKVDERIEYKGKGDFTLILAKGEQTITGDDLIKYFRYTKLMGADGLKLQGRLICAMLDNYINMDNLENGLTIFEKLLSKINSKSDINHVEAVEMMSKLKTLCRSGERKDAEVILDTAELVPPEQRKKEGKK